MTVAELEELQKKYLMTGTSQDVAFACLEIALQLAKQAEFLERMIVLREKQLVKTGEVE